jgi:hypothetical protein
LKKIAEEPDDPVTSKDPERNAATDELRVLEEIAEYGRESKGRS